MIETEFELADIESIEIHFLAEMSKSLLKYAKKEFGKSAKVITRPSKRGTGFKIIVKYENKSI